MDKDDIRAFYDKAVDTLILLEEVPADTPRWDALTADQRAIIDQLLHEAGSRIAAEYMDEG